jgi:squalene-associated FAD-dependent desaturase
LNRAPHGQLSVVVVGGGLAGMAAALKLAQAGYRVTLLEQRPFLGGRAYSFEDPDTGAEIDNGQHILVGACTRLRGFLDAIGAPASAFVRQPRLGVTILDPDGRRATLTAAPVPAPLHMAAAVLRYRHLDLRQRASVARDARALANLDNDAYADLENIPFGDWLSARGAATTSIERFWDPLVRPALNVVASEANIPLTAFFVREALWAGPHGGAIWLPSVGLTRAIGEPGHQTLERTGVVVRLSARVETVEIGNHGIAGVRLRDGERLETTNVVCAVPPEALERILPTSARPPTGYTAIGSSAIVNVYLWYDRPITDLDFAGTFGSDLQWIFNRSQLLGAHAAGHCLGVSLSAADGWVDMPKDAVAQRCDRAIERMFPARHGAELIRSAVVKEPRATFRAGPNVARYRPGPVGAIDGLYLAGDWTDTAWPATMEGAVRSGESAAEALLVQQRSATQAALIR